MKYSLTSALNNSLREFKRGLKLCAKDSSLPVAGWLRDNYYILEKTAKQLILESRHISKKQKGSDFIPGLFDKCKSACEDGVLPSQERIIEIFKNSSIAAAGHLPFMFSCVLIVSAAEGVKMNNAKGVKLLSNAIASLRHFDELDFDFITQKIVLCEEVLKRDPSGIYEITDSISKDKYRKRIARKAAESGKSEAKIAGEALIKAQKSNEHIGKHLFNGKKNITAGLACITAEYLMPLCAAAAAGILLSSFWTGFLLFFPLCAIFRNPVERAFLASVKPKRFLRIRNSEDLPHGSHALLTVSTLLPSPDKMKALERHLEKLYLSNGGADIRVCCLADFKAADMPSKPEDKVVLKAARDMTDRLNSAHGGGFILAVRPRLYSKTQGVFTGKERKRGAINDLVCAVKGNQKGFIALHGDKADFEKTKYIIALDSDTELGFDGARELICVAEHPLNRPKINTEKGRVTDGYGILVPKAVNKIGAKTRFADIMSGDAGVSSYDSLANEKYQDLFGEGIFCGKGLIDVESYYCLMTKGMPEEMILSHDIIESGYLRAGYVSDVYVTESFPQSAGSYFARLHRWVRGDWQNIKFIFGRNPLNLLSRYKLIDNLFRSLQPAISLVVLAASIFFDGKSGTLLAGTALFSVMASDVYAGIASLVNGGFSALSRKFYSGIFPEAVHCFARGFANAALWVRESITCLSAAVKALWRLFVSKKNLLEWATAASSEKTKNAAALLSSCAESVFASILLFIFGDSVHRLAGLFILADVPLTLISNTEKRTPTRRIEGRNADTLMQYASSMWRFFDELCTEEHNYLPPDNIQLSPSRAVAARTSPTNIGLMLVSFLAARDLGFIGSYELFEKLDKSLKTVEKLEKYKGNLLNWYSTHTCCSIGEKFVSTVDSGNFLCCLVALKEGLKEYVSEHPALSGIIQRAQALIDETDIAVLYNERKRLFYIGVFAETETPTENCYDLYMSEARMTSYFAVAKRKIPQKHWGAMGRMLVSNGGYCGLASWTGTMFEYYMPNIFMPAKKGSIDYESLRFCLRCQRKRAGSKPFGISESGFYAFDGSLNYQYKAHGIQKLGLKRGLDKEYVVSPYSSFLTLTTAPVASMKNLKTLEKSGATGQYGFYEAVDYTRQRCSGNEFRIVRSFMAHHVGMSLLSANNALNNNVMQKRFMRDKAMIGAESLLDEKIQRGAPVFKDIYDKNIVSVREKINKKSRISENPCVFSPKTTAFSNGRLTTCISDVGVSMTLFDGISITVPEADIFSRPQGVFAVFVDEEGVKPFVSVLDKSGIGKYRAEFRQNAVFHEAKHGFLKLEMKTAVKRNKNCEIRRLTVSSTSKTGSIKGKLLVYFEPCLDKKSDFSAHPAFSKLFLTDEWNEEGEFAVFSRTVSGKKELCSVAAGFADVTDIKHEFSREKVLQTPRGVFSLGSKTDFGGNRGNPDCCGAFSVEVDIKAGESAQFNFIIAAEEDREQAVNTFLSAKAENKSEKNAHLVLGSDILDIAVGEKILPAILYHGCRARLIEGEKNYIPKKEHLWSFGLSGDNPIVLVKAESLGDASAVSPYIRVNMNLRSCGIESDLVLAYEGAEGYRSEIRNELRNAVSQAGCELMVGVKGGIHIINLRNHTDAQVQYLELCAAMVFKPENGNMNDSEMRYKPLKSVEFGNGLNEKNYTNNVKQYNFTSREITIKKKPVTVDIPWNLALCNKSFGTMVSDKALGFTWALNSRENKLSPWYNDTLSDNRGEMLIMKYNGVLYDLISLSKAVFTPQKASWFLECCSVEFKVSVEVADRGMAKKCRVEISNKSDSPKELDIAYYMLPVLGVNRENINTIAVNKIVSGAVFRSFGGEMPGAAALQCDGKADYICLSRREFWEGRFNSENESENDCCVAVGRKVSLAVGGKISLSFLLSWGATEEAAIKMPFVSSFSGLNTNALRIPDKHGNLALLFNSFLYSQIKNSRFYGRTGFYQCSGAYGFRDQLQDCLALVYSSPKIVRTHIIRCAAVQFFEGDVLHWWHVTVDKVQKRRGVRTKCSDDLLWLPFVCCDYIKKTGDTSILDVNVPYIESELLGKNEKDRYVIPLKTDFKETVFEHCVRAIDKSLSFGRNGLPLIGSCDWNDGFSAVGDAESGESVWLALFLIRVIKDFAPICEMKNFKKRGDKYLRVAEKLEKSINSFAWEKNHYVRAFCKDGTVLGGEDFIDILPQAFAVFADLKDKARIEAALNSAYEALFDEKNGIIRLFNRPFFSDDAEKVGYIAKYPAGIRENSGQYTHAAVWLASAMLKFGKIEEGKRLLNAINPTSFYSDEAKAKAYRAEPYVLAADVSYADRLIGRAGWTHFTGSAAWLYKIVIEDLMGWEVKKGVLTKTENSLSVKDNRLTNA